MELLKESVPKVTRVGVVFESGNAGSLRELKETLPGPTRSLGLTLRSWEVRGPDNFDVVFSRITKDRPDGVYVTSSPMITANLKRIASFLSKNRLPSVGSNTAYANEGGLISYDADNSDTYQRVAVYVDKS